MYKWFQQTGVEPWELILSSHEERVVRDKKPAFVTILACDNAQVVTAEKPYFTREEYDKMRYAGPLYFDFDADDLEEACRHFRGFLGKLRDDVGFELNQAQYFASGGKGFHILIPAKCFIEKVSTTGYAFLPAIYKAMAMDIQVPTMDFRVYSAKMGRMFRTVNVERPDKPGVYKVEVTLDEALSITPDKYRELIKAPRYLPEPAAPTVNAKLAVLFSACKDRVESAAKGRKSAEKDEKLLKKFGGESPPTVQALMRGEGVSADAGFQRIATQLSITAHALGINDVDTFVNMCEGLCQNHQSDGTRYNSPALRRKELARMYFVMADDPTYQFSVGGIKSVMEKGFATPDFDSDGVPYTDEELPPGDGEAHVEVENSITQNVRVNQFGIFRKTEDGTARICAMGIADPVQLVNVETQEVIGFDVDIFVDGKPQGRRTMSMDTFQGRNNFLKFTLSLGGCSMSGNDQQASGVADILRTRAAQKNNVTYTTRREGVDVVRLPAPDGRFDQIWADNQEVHSKLGMKYVLKPGKNIDPQYQTDLWQCSKLEDTPESRDYFRHLFTINTPETLGGILGWMVAAFYTQVIRKVHSQFPLLHVYGQAGSGKSATLMLLAQMHYYQNPPKIISAADITPWALDLMLSTSGSMPLILDEYKPREMRADTLKRLRLTLRNNFIGAGSARGKLSTETGAAKLANDSPGNFAPVAFLAEAMETQTGLVERCVHVPISKVGKRGHSGDFSLCKSKSHNLSSFGRTLANYAVRSDFDKVRKRIDELQDEVRAKMSGDQIDDDNRPIYSIAITLFGLEAGKFAMRQVFGDTFDADWDRFMSARMGKINTMVSVTKSEASKVLDVFAYMSRSEDQDTFRLIYGKDFVVTPQTQTARGHTIPAMVQIDIQSAFIKYQRFTRSTGEECLYDSYDAFLSALAEYSPVVDRMCMISPLRDALKLPPTTKVYGFSIPELEKEGVGEFVV